MPDFFFFFLVNVSELTTIVGLVVKHSFTSGKVGGCSTVPLAL